ncbi:DUF1761 domain-containing protein [Cohaesibacter celericrescens]|uniref:DUF1761 domain-containing protein n=1 Tax=Cohaesibacter celericrescens TaxID=2067669 RepID=A0A2N5XP43_9HYPH|nr:DUF1761 domain-containing protein [Cohaesibacter celericrescens]PLW76272.1 DUF1761 domain-containing protein [Cohaesibacter celericrescens]
MPFNEINWIAVLVSAFVGYAIGAVWYMSLSNPWMAAAGLTKDMIKGKNDKQNPMPFIIAAIANIVMAMMLFGILVHVGDPTPIRGIISAVFIWIGFVLTTLSVNNAYQMKPLRLTLIDGGHWLVNLVAQGAILGWFG